MTSHILFFGLLSGLAFASFVIITTAATKGVHKIGYIMAIIFGVLGIGALVMWNIPDISIDFSRQYIYSPDVSPSQWRYAAPFCNAGVNVTEKIIAGMAMGLLGTIYTAGIIVGGLGLNKLLNSS